MNKFTWDLTVTKDTIPVGISVYAHEIIRAFIRDAMDYITASMIIEIYRLL